MNNQNNPQSATKIDLYPLQFKPILKSVIWGGDKICHFKQIDPIQDGIGESWEISGVPNNVSVVTNGPLAGEHLDSLLSTYKEQLVGRKSYKQFKDTFPLLIKFIDARDNLSIQVHPNDELAKARHNSFGKTEMWYVIDATPEAFLYAGFNQQMTPEKYLDSVSLNTFTEKLKRFDVKKGDTFFLPAGKVHAIGAGCFIAEIQQTSDVTYRIYDYNRKDASGKSRELHTELAKDAIDYGSESSCKVSYNKKINEPIRLVNSSYFTTSLLDLNLPIKRIFEPLDSFVIYICMEGSCHLEDHRKNRIHMKQGDTLLLPADTLSVTIEPEIETKLVETYIE